MKCIRCEKEANVVCYGKSFCEHCLEIDYVVKHMSYRELKRLSKMPEKESKREIDRRINLLKKEMPEETKFRIVIGLDSGVRLTSKWVSKKETKKELEEIKQEKGKYITQKDGQSFVERKKIAYVLIQESD